MLAASGGICSFCEDIWVSVEGCCVMAEGRFEGVFLRKGFEEGSSADILAHLEHQFFDHAIVVLYF